MPDIVFYSLDVFFMVHLSEYRKKSHNDFPSPLFCPLKAWIFAVSEVNKKKTGAVVWRKSGETGKILIFEKLKSL